MRYSKTRQKTDSDFVLEKTCNCLLFIFVCVFFNKLFNILDVSNIIFKLTELNVSDLVKRYASVLYILIFSIALPRNH